MNIYPSLEEARRFAAEGQYQVLPVSCEILSDFITPIEALRILKQVSSHCFLLESALADEKWGRYTFLGFEPKLEITCLDGESVRSREVRLGLSPRRVNFFGPAGCSPNATAREGRCPAEV